MLKNTINEAELQASEDKLTRRKRKAKGTTSMIDRFKRWGLKKVTNDKEKLQKEVQQEVKELSRKWEKYLKAKADIDHFKVIQTHGPTPIQTLRAKEG